MVYLKMIYAHCCRAHDLRKEGVWGIKEESASPRVGNALSKWLRVVGAKSRFSAGFSRGGCQL